MNYHDITKSDMLNGEGLRVVLWVSGCEHYCDNCQNPQTWSYDGGIPFDDNAKQEIFEELKKDYIAGLTLSGGDPFAKKNRNEVFKFLNQVKTKFPDKNIWCYTGYRYEDIKHLRHLWFIDILVDGKFDEQLSKPSPKWCGSANQRIIDVQKSLQQKKVVLKEED